jgi:hypothetical protein
LNKIKAVCIPSKSGANNTESRGQDKRSKSKHTDNKDKWVKISF